jgi:hypothetical protein
MPRSLVALLAAVAAALAVLASLAPGYLVWVIAAVVAAAAGLVGYATAPDLPVLIAPDLPAIAQKKVLQACGYVDKYSTLWISIHKVYRAWPVTDQARSLSGSA